MFKVFIHKCSWLMLVFSLVFFFLYTPGSHLFCNWNQHKQTVKSNCVMNYSYRRLREKRNLRHSKVKPPVRVCVRGHAGWSWISGFIDALSNNSAGQDSSMMSPVTINWSLATWMALTRESPVSFWKMLFHFHGSMVLIPFSLGASLQTPSGSNARGRGLPWRAVHQRWAGAWQSGQI